MAKLVQSYKGGKDIMISGYDKKLPSELFLLQSKDKEHVYRAPDGFSVAINAEISSELKAEGLYRELLRHCQVLWKEAGFAVPDRVILSFQTESTVIHSVLEI